MPIKIEKRLELQKFSPFEIRKFIYEKKQPYCSFHNFSSNFVGDWMS